MRNLKEYFRPGSAAEAVDIKTRFGPEAVYLAGGSDLLVHRPEGVRAVIDIRHAGLGACSRGQDWHTIGGAALLRDVEDQLGDLAGGMLGAAVRDTAPWLIRNAATLAGNVANASPAADAVPALLALDAELDLLDGGTSTAQVEELMLGPHLTSLGDRLITRIRIPLTAGFRRAVFTKLARSKSDIALVNMAVALRLDGGRAHEVRVALGAVAPTAVRAREAESLLEGQELSNELVMEVEQTVRAEVRPISDWRASEEYRRRMSGLLVRRALERIGESAKMEAER